MKDKECYELMRELEAISWTLGFLKAFNIEGDLAEEYLQDRHFNIIKALKTKAER